MRRASALLLSLLLVGACAVAPERAPAPAPAYPEVSRQPAPTPAPVPEVPREQPPTPAPVPEVTPKAPVLAPIYPEFKHGAIDPGVIQENIQQTICVSGYTSTVRPPTSYTNRIKVQLMVSAGIDPNRAKDFELDHIIPLAIGGEPWAVENLQLQPWEGSDGAKRKDRIEVKLQCLVCSGQVLLEVAQREIADDWQAAYQHYATVKCTRPTQRPVPGAG